MKKAFVILLCVMAFSLASCNKEKPNEKFVGTYIGVPTATGTVSLNGEPFPEFENQELPQLTMIIAAGDKKDQVTATCLMDDQTQVVNGIVDETTVDFDPTTLKFKIGDLGDLELEATVDLNAMLSNANLVLAGTAVSEGEIEMPIIGALPYKAEATISGTLLKQAQ